MGRSSFVTALAVVCVMGAVVARADTALMLDAPSPVWGQILHRTTPGWCPAAVDVELMDGTTSVCTTRATTWIEDGLVFYRALVPSRCRDTAWSWTNGPDRSGGVAGQGSLRLKLGSTVLTPGTAVPWNNAPSPRLDIVGPDRVQAGCELALAPEAAFVEGASERTTAHLRALVRKPPLGSGESCLSARVRWYHTTGTRDTKLMAEGTATFGSSSTVCLAVTTSFASADQADRGGRWLVRVAPAMTGSSGSWTGPSSGRAVGARLTRKVVSGGDPGPVRLFSFRGGAVDESAMAAAPTGGTVTGTSMTVVKTVGASPFGPSVSDQSRCELTVTASSGATPSCTVPVVTGASVRCLPEWVLTVEGAVDASLASAAFDGSRILLDVTYVRDGSTSQRTLSVPLRRAVRTALPDGRLWWTASSFLDLDGTGEASATLTGVRLELSAPGLSTSGSVKLSVEEVVVAEPVAPLLEI